MTNKKGFYNAYNLDTLKHGESIKCDHKVTLIRERMDLSTLVPLPLSELERRRKDSICAENAIFEQLKTLLSKWEGQAAITQLLNRAIEYDKCPAVEHSSNQWQEKRGVYSVSNMVYKMAYNVYEETRYNRETETSEPVVWYLTWSVKTNGPRSGNSVFDSTKIAGQDGKRFTDKAAMEKYLAGRVAAYSSLFTEISPPLPSEYARHFTVNGLLLPGYNVAAEEAAAVRVPESERPQESVLARINADKAAKREKVAADRDEPAPQAKRHNRGKDEAEH
ncbi:hypothetical protein FACS189490_04200 [Clostridia bacterium]|nr:hypothetical protein FACS189490_04200 [Clostridia bacterium]